MPRVKLALIESPQPVAEMQAEEKPGPQVETMTFSAGDAVLLGEYARVAAMHYHGQANYVRVNKLGDELARKLEQKAITAELLASIIESQVG